MRSDSTPAALWLRRLAAGTLAAMTLAAAVGLASPDVYHDNPMVTAGWFGTDLVTLLVAVPVTAFALRADTHGSARGRMVLLGMLLYAFYNYAFYLFGAAFNAFFLVYVAVVTTSGIGLLLGFLSLDVDKLASGFAARAPARSVALFHLAVGLLLGGFWTAVSLAYLLSGDPPAMVSATGHPTNVTGALDLSIVVTLALVSGHLLWRRRSWGYPLAVMWNVKGAVYMLALASATLTAYSRGVSDGVALAGVWVSIGVGCTLALVALLARYEHSRVRAAS
jgi:hypothetical protein